MKAETGVVAMMFELVVVRGGCRSNTLATLCYFIREIEVV